MREYAKKTDKKIHEQEQKTKNCHEIKFSLSSRSKSETEEEC